MRRRLCLVTLELSECSPRAGSEAASIYAQPTPDEKLSTNLGQTAMLVLSRKNNESIIINENIVVTVVQVRGDTVRLGIEAPKEVTVHRREVYDAIKESDKTRKD